MIVRIATLAHLRWLWAAPIIAVVTLGFLLLLPMIVIVGIIRGMIKWPAYWALGIVEAQLLRGLHKNKGRLTFIDKAFAFVVGLRYKIGRDVTMLSK